MKKQGHTAVLKFKEKSCQLHVAPRDNTFRQKVDTVQARDLQKSAGTKKDFLNMSDVP